MYYTLRILLIIGVITQIHASHRHIIFDFGGVILDAPPDSMYHVDADWASTVRSSYIWRQWMKGMISRHKAQHTLYQQFPSHIVDRVIMSSLSPHRQRSDVTIHMIRCLKNAGYSIYLLSNLSQSGYEQFIADTEIELLFDGIVCSYQVGYVKPDPAIYEQLTNMYDIPVEQAMFIDDKPENVQAARDIGITGIVYHHYQTPDDIYAELICT